MEHGIAVKTSPGQKIAKGLCLSLLALIALLLLVIFLFSALFPLFYRDYFGNGQKNFKIPGLRDGLVSQGFTAVEDNFLLQCGYMSDGKSASRIYQMKTEKNGNRLTLKDVSFVELYNSDGTPFLGHTGGIAVAGDFVYLANDDDTENGVFVLSLAKLKKTENGGRITLEQFFTPETRSACCYVSDGLLFVGEFFKDPEYQTKKSHTLTATDGSEQSALICAYRLDDSAEFGVDLSAPELAISVCGMLQGFARTEDGKFILSTSYGLSSSHLYLHKNVLAEETKEYYSVNGTQVPLYFLDGNSLEKTVALPPMSEELVYQEGSVYVLCESASEKYLFGRFIRGSYVYSYPMS